MNATPIACPGCGFVGETKQAIPRLPEALSFDCPKCLSMFVAMRMPDGRTKIALCTRTHAEVGA